MVWHIFKLLAQNVSKSTSDLATEALIIVRIDVLLFEFASCLGSGGTLRTSRSNRNNLRSAPSWTGGKIW